MCSSDSKTSRRRQSYKKSSTSTLKSTGARLLHGYVPVLRQNCLDHMQKILAHNTCTSSTEWKFWSPVLACGPTFTYLPTTTSVYKRFNHSLRICCTLSYSCCISTLWKSTRWGAHANLDVYVWNESMQDMKPSLSSLQTQDNICTSINIETAKPHTLP